MVAFRLQVEEDAADLLQNEVRLGFPEGCLVALIHRRGHMVVPRGSTVLEEDDQLTIIGDERGIRSLKDRFKTVISDE